MNLDGITALQPKARIHRVLDHDASRTNFELGRACVTGVRALFQKAFLLHWVVPSVPPVSLGSSDGRQRRAQPCPPWRCRRPRSWMLRSWGVRATPSPAETAGAWAVLGNVVQGLNIKLYI